MGTQTESAEETSIADDLRSAFAEAEPEGASETPEVNVQTEAESQTLEEILEAPQHWPEDARKQFSELGKLPNGKYWQQWNIERHKAMEGDYTKKSQSIAEFRKTYEPLQKLFEPYLQELQANNLTVPDLIQRYLQADQYLQKSPAEAIKWLADSYGIDLAAVVNGQKTEVDPYVKQLEQKLQKLESSWQSREHQEQQARITSTVNEITGFAEEKDESGNPKHPHFNDVVNDMVLLAQAAKASGQSPKLQDLYDRAVWANPDVRQKLIAAQSEAEAKKRADEAAKKAGQAKKASASVSGSPGATAPRTDRTLREDLEAAIG